MDAQELRNLQEAYLEVAMNELDEGASEDVAARSEKLANQRKGQTPQRKAMYKGLALNARIRASGGNPGDKPQGHPLRKASNRPIRPHDSKYGRSGLTQSERDERRDIDAATHGEYSDGPGTKTKNPKKLRKQKAMGEIGESYDLYDIILSHLLDEGYAETQEQAEVIMVNMSEEWRESIFEAEVLAQKGGVPGTVQMNKTREGGFLGIGSKEVSKPVPGSFKEKDVSSKDAARYNTGIDKKFGSADNIDNTSAANVQYAANRAGNSGYMKVKDPGSLPNTGIPNRPTPGRASDQNQARQMSGDIVRMNRR